MLLTNLFFSKTKVWLGYSSEEIHPSYPNISSKKKLQKYRSMDLPSIDPGWSQDHQTVKPSMSKSKAGFPGFAGKNRGTNVKSQDHFRKSRTWGNWETSTLNFNISTLGGGWTNLFAKICERQIGPFSQTFRVANHNMFETTTDRWTFPPTNHPFSFFSTGQVPSKIRFASFAWFFFGRDTPTACRNRRKGKTKIPVPLWNCWALRIIGPCYGGVWLCIAGVWHLQTISFEIPWFLGKKAPTDG